MEIRRKKQTHIQKNLFTMTSGGLLIVLSHHKPQVLFILEGTNITNHQTPPTSSQVSLFSKVQFEKILQVGGGRYFQKSKILEVDGGWYFRKSKITKVGGWCSGSYLYKFKVNQGWWLLGRLVPTWYLHRFKDEEGWQLLLRLVPSNNQR